MGIHVYTHTHTEVHLSHLQALKNSERMFVIGGRIYISFVADVSSIKGSHQIRAVKQKGETAISSGPLPRFEPELPAAALACWEQERHSTCCFRTLEGDMPRFKSWLRHFTFLKVRPVHILLLL